MEDWQLLFLTVGLSTFIALVIVIFRKICKKYGINETIASACEEAVENVIDQQLPGAKKIMDEIEKVIDEKDLKQPENVRASSITQLRKTTKTPE